MAVWPASLPQSPFIGLSHTRVDAVVRSPVSVGPFKTRRRATVAIQPVGVPIVLTNPQRTTFDTFYITTLIEGSDTFDWKDPVDGSTVTLAFESPPLWASFSTDQDGPIWRTVMPLLILP